MTLYTKDDFQTLFPKAPPEALTHLSVYQALLVKWNKAINLVSPKTIGESWHRHIIDSAQVAPYISDQARCYADLGCGGGFPGLVVAMMRPALDVHLVESDERKGQFMRTVIRETGIKNATVHTARVEDMTDILSPDIVTARALASLEQLFAYCLPWAERKPDFAFCFMKGERADEEVRAAQERFDFTVHKHQSLTDPQAALLVGGNLQQRA